MSIDVLILYRNANYGKPGTLMMGLGVNAYHSIAVLKRLGYTCAMAGVWTAADVDLTLAKHYAQNAAPRWCVIEAPWLSISDTVHLVRRFPQTNFAVRCHSNVGFLQVEPGAVLLLREIMLHSESEHNLFVASNSSSFQQFVQRVYHARCLLLPNLYNRERVTTRRWQPWAAGRHTLKAGSFGAIRLQKNHPTGAAAALMLAREIGADVEFTITTGRVESPGAEAVVQAIQNMMNGLPWARLIRSPWACWPIFRRTVAEQDICFHLSATETFNLTTADALAEGVPVVGSEAIDWLPKTWQANLDDPGAAAEAGRKLLFDHTVPETCARTLANVCANHEASWKTLLGPAPS